MFWILIGLLQFMKLTHCLLLGSDNDPNWVVSKAVFPSDSVSVATALHVGFNLPTRGSGDTGRSCFFLCVGVL